MSSAQDKRAAVMASLQQELRNFSDQDVLFSQALADRLGITLTDLKGLSILERNGAVTAGKLAELTGLTTGAITGLVDRLEKAGWARRVRDPDDRRHVIIQAASERSADFEALFGPAGSAMAGWVEDYSEAQLRFLLEFLTRGAGMLREQTAKLRAEAGAPGVAGPSGEFSSPLGELKRASLRFLSGLSRATLNVDAQLETLYVARFEGKAPAVREEAGAVSVRYARFTLLDWRKQGADVTLNGSIPWHIELKGGVSKLNADLGTLRLEALELTGGASDSSLVLPKPSGTVPIRISGGASDLSLSLPGGAAARLQVKGGVSKLAFQEHRLGAVGGLMSLESPEYKNTPDRYDIELLGGASNLTITNR